MLDLEFRFGNGSASLVVSDSVSVWKRDAQTEQNFGGKFDLVLKFS